MPYLTSGGPMRCTGIFAKTWALIGSTIGGVGSAINSLLSMCWKTILGSFRNALKRHPVAYNDIMENNVHPVEPPNSSADAKPRFVPRPEQDENGVDLSLIRENLRLTATERVRRADRIEEHGTAAQECQQKLSKVRSKKSSKL